MSIKFKKQIAKTPTGIIISPETSISNKEMQKNEQDYRKSDHFKKKKK